MLSNRQKLSQGVSPTVAASLQAPSLSGTNHSHVRHFKQQAQEFLFSLVELFSSAAAGHGRRHDHQTTVDHALMRGLVTAGPVMRRGASSV